MNKVLFLSFPYPYAKYGPSTQCCLRIMKRLVETGRYEVHCISYSSVNRKKNFEDVPEIILHPISLLDPRRNEDSKFKTHLKQILTIPIYPFRHLTSSYHHYLECKKILKKEKYDLVVSQCYSEQSLLSGVLLKKHGYIDKLMVIFWDNIYGLLPQRSITRRFILRRQRKAESWMAKYIDKLVSLYPIKAFHEKYGDVPNAIGKRVYLGIPSLVPPKVMGESSYKNLVLADKTNVLYSGTIYNIGHVSYLIKMLNASGVAGKTNLIVFGRGLSEVTIAQLKLTFNGTLQVAGWIPLDDLLALFPIVDYFVSFPGNPNAICSKVFEYMSFGKPVLVFYEHDSDVNSMVFSRYPASLMVDIRRSIEENAREARTFLEHDYDLIPFETTEKLFKLDSPSAYLELIDNMLNQ